LATVRGSIPNRRAASRWLNPSIWTAYLTRPYSSTRFIPAPCRLTARGYLLPDFYSGATGQSGRFIEGVCLRRLQVRLATGGRLRIAVSAAGIAILSACEEAERRRLIARVNADIRRVDDKPDDFNKALDRCMKTGVAIVRNLWHSGIGGVSVPIRSQGEIAALTIPVSTGSVSETVMGTTLADELREVAARFDPVVPEAGEDRD
jgi:hypothetical protein